jgi:peroxiredoxin
MSGWQDISVSGRIGLLKRRAAWVVVLLLFLAGCDPWADPTAAPAATPTPTPQATPTRKPLPPTGAPPTGAPRTQVRPRVGLDVGDRAPDFELFDLQGRAIRLSDLRGQVVMLNFWAVWCGFCRIEFPVMQSAYERHQNDGFVVLAIDIQETQEAVQAFAEDVRMTFPVLLDSRGQVASAYRIRGLPTSLFIDAEGVIQVVRIGPVDEALLEQYLTQLGVH